MNKNPLNQNQIKYSELILFMSGLLSDFCCKSCDTNKNFSFLGQNISKLEYFYKKKPWKKIFLQS